MYSATISGHGAFSNGFSGRSNGSAVAVVNEAGEFGFLPGEDSPYTPIGGRKTLALVLDCLEFRAFNWGSTVTIKKGRKF
jgi:hypothetical protein